MPYDMKAHWVTLQVSLDTYQKESKIDAQNVPDQLAYETQKQVLHELLQKGTAIEKTLLPKKKLELASQLGTLLKQMFGPDETPTIMGTKSFDFAQTVYLPHLKRIGDIKYKKLTIALSKKIGFNIEEKRVQAAQQAALLENRIKDYILNHPTLTQSNQTLFPSVTIQPNTNIAAPQANNLIKPSV